MIIRDDSQQTTTIISVMETDGTRRAAVCVSCNIRPGKGMSISAEVVDGSAVSGEHLAEVMDAVAECLGNEIAKAAALGVPVKLPAAAPTA